MSAALEEFKEAGLLKVEKRPYQSKRISGFNSEVYSAWIGRWAQHAAVNYPVISAGWGASFLNKSAAGLPAIVIGIGPSLDDNIEVLRYASQRAILIATDASLRPLLRHGIRPDLVMNYDARAEQKSMWESIDTTDLVLVANTITSPHTLDAWKGKIIFFNMIQVDDEFATNILPAIYPHIGGLPSMGTVGNGAIYLAHQMGCAPILTVGMDLCYREDGTTTEVLPAPDSRITNQKRWRYRCKDYLYRPNDTEFPEGWVECENKVLYDNARRMAETFDLEHKGQTFRVDAALRFYANSLLNNIGLLDLPVVDCSGGILSKYIKSLPLADAIKTKCPKPIYPGQTVVRHLSQIVPDCKKGRAFDGEFWDKNIPTRGGEQ